MKFNEIVKKYQNEWLIIEVKEFDKETLEIKEGEVIFRSPCEDDVLKNLSKCKGRHLAIEYTGKPAKIEVLL